ncbi:MAG: multicopper oxidase family protein [Gemmatimonadota bacterium]
MVRWSILLATLILAHPASASATPGSVGDTLKNPPILVNRSTRPRMVELYLTSAKAQMALVPGKPTEVFAFNGTVPGPTIDLREGDSVVVHFTNNLNEPTSVHWHGLHLPADMDGSPLIPVPPGGKKDYRFFIEPNTAGTYWYHPHPDIRTGYQVAKGLYGALIIHAAKDPLPAMPEKLLILADNRFNPDGSINFSAPRTPEAIVDEENGREGKVMLINGQVMPTIKIRSGEVQRWRIINTGAARLYRLSIPGQPFLQVGTDGGLFEKPEEIKELMLSNSERAEILVRGTGAPGSKTIVKNLPYDRYTVQTRPATWNEPHNLLTLAYSSEPRVKPIAIPAVMRVIPALDTMKVSVRRNIVLSQGMINSKMMDMKRVDVRAKLGAYEIWTIENVVGMDHPFHLHGYRFQLLDRNGVPEKVRRWKDTVNVPKHSRLRFIVHFDANPGNWMFHCHILDHEDHGMMGVLQVY